MTDLDAKAGTLDLACNFLAGLSFNTYRSVDGLLDDQQKLAGLILAEGDRRAAEMRERAATTCATHGRDRGAIYQHCLGAARRSKLEQAKAELGRKVEKRHPSDWPSEDAEELRCTF